MSWNVTVNSLISAASNAERCLRFFLYMNQRLFEAGWSQMAYGDGASVFGKNATGYATNQLPDFDAVSISPVASGVWVVFENADGLQCCMQCASSYIDVWWTVDGNYLAETPGPYDDAGDSTRPGSSTAVTDEVHLGHEYYTTSSDFYMTSAMSTDNNSFIFFGKDGTRRNCASIIKCDPVKTGDAYPYWGYLNLYDTDSFKATDLADGGTSYSFGYHPVGGYLGYRLTEPCCDTDFMDSMPVDPNTGKEQLVECLAVHASTAIYRHIRGTVPGFLRCSSDRSAGDTFNGGEYMCMDDYALPWDGTLTSLL